MSETLSYQSVLPRRSSPRSLLIVAAIFLAAGILSVLHMIVMPVTGRGIVVDVTFCVGILGWGLLRHHAVARGLALVCIWCVMVATFLGQTVLLVAAVGRLRAGEAIFSNDLPWHIMSALLFSMAALFAVAVWQYRVLVRPDVRALFK